MGETTLRLHPGQRSTRDAYVGVTGDLVRRVWEHRSDAVDGFTKKYQVRTLVYFETHVGMEAAILREKQLKGWKRDWKVELIQRQNPHWNDLYVGLTR